MPDMEECMLDQRLSGAKGEQKDWFMVPKGESRAPGVLNTFVVFFLFFHLARRFWNQTWRQADACVMVEYAN